MPFVIIIILLFLIGGIASGSPIAWLILIGLIITIVVLVRNEKEKEKLMLENANSQKENLERQGFDVLSKQLPYSNMHKIYVDGNKRQLAFCNCKTNNTDIVNFSKIVQVEILENGGSIAGGGVGRAIVGGALAGGIGAIVGANTRKSENVVNSLSVRIVTKEENKSLILIPIIEMQTKIDSETYKSAMMFAQKLYAEVLSVIDNNVNNVVVEKNDIPLSDKIRELAKLKEDGILTEEEFSVKKQELLNRI